jgi:hypothetical protein
MVGGALGSRRLVGARLLPSHRGPGPRSLQKSAVGSRERKKKGHHIWFNLRNWSSGNTQLIDRTRVGARTIPWKAIWPTGTSVIRDCVELII